MTKSCNKCKEVKSLDSFSKLSASKDGLMYSCKVCDKAKSTAYYEANSDKINDSSRAWYAANSDKRKVSQKAWREANPDYNKAWQEANPEKARASKKAWYESNLEKVKAIDKAYYAANSDKVKARTKAWAEANPDRAAAMAGKSLAISRGGSVSDSYDLELCIPFYAESRRRTRETGIKHDVDHIIPISKGGLHCQSNLQVLTAYENRSKGDTV